MPQSYKITKVSEQEPRVYDGQYGTVYYIKVMLDGHNKPVEIGKKDPNALKVGDEVYGDIKPSEYPSDGFKSAQKPYGTPGGDELKSKLDAIHGDLKLTMSMVRSLQKRLDATPQEDVVVDVDTDKEMTLDDFGAAPVNLDDIPF